MGLYGFQIARRRSRAKSEAEYEQRVAAARAEPKPKGRKVGSVKASIGKANTLARRGFTQAEIAKQLGVTTRTVRRYLAKSAALPTEFTE